MKRSVKRRIMRSMRDKSPHKNCGGSYFLGMVGSAVYFISTSTGFWNGVLGVLKALVWPAFVVFYLLKFLGA